MLTFNAATSSWHCLPTLLYRLVLQESRRHLESAIIHPHFKPILAEPNALGKTPARPVFPADPVIRSSQISSSEVGFESAHLASDSNVTA